MTPRIASEADGLARQWAAAPAFMRHVGFTYGNRPHHRSNALKAVRAFKEHIAAEGMEQQWRGRRVLEVGVGDGWLGVELLKSVGVKRYLGVDLSDDSLAQTRGALLKAGLAEGRDFELSSAHVPLRALAPDVVVSQWTIQHFPSEAYTRAWLRNVSQSGASRVVLHFCGPCNASAHARELISCGGWERGPWSHGKLGMGARCLMTTEAALGELSAAQPAPFALAWRKIEGAQEGLRATGVRERFCDVWAGFHRAAPRSWLSSLVRAQSLSV